MAMPVSQVWFPGMSSNGVNERAVKEIIKENGNEVDFIQRVRDRANTSSVRYRSNLRGDGNRERTNDSSLSMLVQSAYMVNSQDDLKNNSKFPVMRND